MPVMGLGAREMTADKRRHSLALPHLESGAHPADIFSDALRAVTRGGQGCYRRTYNSGPSLALDGPRKTFWTR